MFSIDMKTVIFFACLIDVMSLMVIGLLWYQNRRRFAGLSLWVADYAMQMVAMLVLYLRGVVPVLASIIASNTLLLGGTIVLLMGLQRFVGRKDSQVHNWVLLAFVIVVMAYFGNVQPILWVRSVTVNASLFLLCFQGMWLMLRRVETELRPITRGVGIAFGGLCVTSLVRIVGEVVLPTTSNDFFKSGSFDTAMVVALQLFFILLTFSLIMMVNQRLFAGIRKGEDELRLRAVLLDNASDSFFLYDTEGGAHYVNETAHKSLGYTKEELLSSRVHRNSKPESWLLTGPRMQALSQKGKAIFEATIHRKDGSVMPVEAHASIVEHQGKRLILSAVRDITERKKAEDEIAHYVKRVEALNAVAKAVGQTLDMEPLLNGALQKVTEVMGADIGSIYVLDAPGKMLRLKAQLGMSDEAIKEVSIVKLDDEEWRTLVQWSEPNAPLSQVRSSQTLGSVSAALKKEQVRSFVAVPLAVRGSLQGVLSVGSRSDREFGSEDIGLLTAIGSEVAVGIDNSRLMERTRELSVTDEVTGLYNRRHFYHVLEGEVNRTQRYGLPFSVAVLDLDGFKEHNDRFGHATGDAALKSFARTLQAALRKTDVAFRHGGDEFTVILPATETEEAGKILDRFRAEWAHASGVDPAMQESPVGFSAGVAQYPRDADTPDRLMALADAALYRSKREGGHRTTLI